jgi:hypothetical protein
VAWQYPLIAGECKGPSFGRGFLFGSNRINGVTIGK